MNAAVTEWHAWGDLTVTGWAPTLDGERIPDPNNYERVLSYWEVVPGGAAVVRQHRALHDSLMESLADSGMPPAPPVISLWAYPFWSAAFISYVMDQAGLGEAEFPSSASHATYVDSLLARYSVDPQGAPFLPHTIDEYAPVAGDLICADRSRSPITSWTDRLSEAGQFRPMHCDVVVALKPGELQAIGGNVKDAVTMRRLPADAQGRLSQAPYGEAPFFVVFENRLSHTVPSVAGRATSLASVEAPALQR
ncbi:DUF2272 domain-containing protein [Roseomonas elaeocarpi]|uniref:DUF2272 domain-containing protein n=1 Tax=Roseomonas elaeocarpi TaxID=907779 RepID=A0ABV6JQU1_9PROT